ncbi:MAG: hypothetical protein ACOVQA_02720 [Thermoflexibacteraceae bacterium]
MKTKILLTIFFSIATLLSGCKKDDLNIEDGTYKGTFSVIYSSGIKTGQTTLVLMNGKFSCSGNSNRIPAGGSGTFSSDNNKITFNDENFWTTEFDGSLVLTGTYNYTFDGKKLQISRDRNGIRNYNYYLEKQ